MPYRDTQCGFKLFSAKATEKLFAKLTYECSFSETELLYIAHKENAKVYEHPITWTHDPYTRLPIGMKRSLELFFKLLLIRKIHDKI